MRIENALLILLHILVVCKGQALQSGKQRHQITVDTASLASDQFGHIGVLLLRHDGRSGGIGIGEFHKLEFPAAPEDDFLGKTGKMHHQNRKCCQKFCTEVPVGHTVQAVSANAVKTQILRFKVPVCIISSTRQGAAANG